MIRLLSALILLGLWAWGAQIAHDPSLWPTPWQLADKMAQLMVKGDLLYHLWATMVRVLASFTLSMLVGGLIGLAMGRIRLVDQWLDMWLVTLLNVPALLIIVLCYVWGGLNESMAILAVSLTKIPNVASLVRQGTLQFDQGLAELAWLSRMSPQAKLRHLYFPQLAPWLALSARTGMSLLWKIVLVAEFLGRSNGIGFKIHYFFQLFEIDSMLAYALPFSLIMLAVEYGLLQPWERHCRRWLPADTRHES